MGRAGRAKLIYTAITSLDGYIEDVDGQFDWAEPDQELHGFINELERSAGTYLYGRRMYETMRAWETLTGANPAEQDYAEVWRAADKVVYSRTLEAVAISRTRLERDFDADAVRRMKDVVRSDMTIGGPGLAADAFAAGLVDECHFFLTPRDRGWRQGGIAPRSAPGPPPAG